MSTVILSPEQEKALKSILKWLENPSKQYLSLGGYAGTGKTTILAYLRKVLHQKSPKLKIAFCSYTGKASLVLKSTLENVGSLYPSDTVSTIHSLIYTPIIDDEERIIGWERKEKIDADFIIIDEASMVSEDLFTDLLDYGIPILAVGDHGQLPPIKGRFNLMGSPDLRLETIFRQAKGNPIIEVSIMARKSGEIPIKKFSDTVIKYNKFDAEDLEDINDLLESYNKETLLLCGYNHTRVRLNKHIRSILDFTSPYPEVGDRVICLRNNYQKGIYNGMTGIVQSIESVDDTWYNASILMEDGFVFSGLILKAQFNSIVSFNQTDKRKITIGGDLFDFGYAITVHKAQGSQAKRVILFEERFKKMDDQMWKRWLYTGVTRAIEELYIIG